MITPNRDKHEVHRASIRKPPRASYSRSPTASEAVQDGRIYIERINEPFQAAGGSGDQFRAGIGRADPCAVSF
jgi:hypothetical protein